MLDREQVRKVANLARLEIATNEEEPFASQLSSILDYFEQLNELETDDVEPTTRAIDVNNVTRSDELKPFPDREAILQAAPDQNGDFFKVPQILSVDES